MKITNSTGVSRVWPLAVEQWIKEYDRVGDFSITDLNKPPQILQLTRRHDHEMTIDVQDCVYTLLGNGIHKALELAAPHEVMGEERFTIELGGFTISMKPDATDITFLDLEGGGAILYDYKVCKVKKVMFDTPDDWKYQTNGYVYGLAQKGITVSRIVVEAFLRDRDRMEALLDRRYPQHNIHQVEIPIMTKRDIESYLLQRIQLHAAALTLPDDQLPECTLEERWGRPDSFAVLTKGAKPKCLKAGFATRAKAQAFIDSKGDPTKYDMEYRQGHNNRCDGAGDWPGCPCRPWCHQWQTKLHNPF